MVKGQNTLLIQRCCRAFSIKGIVGGMSGATEKEF